MDGVRDSNRRLDHHISICDFEDKALKAMRDRTFRYLKFRKVDASKYNETLTRAWMLAVRHFVARTPDSTSCDDLTAQNEVMLESKIMMTHYSKELLSRLGRDWALGNRICMLFRDTRMLLHSTFINPNRPVALFEETELGHQELKHVRR